MKRIGTLLTQPHFWLYALLVLLPFERIPSWSMAGVTVRLSLLAAAGLIITTFIKYPESVRSWKKPPFVWLLLFLFACLLSAGVAISLSRGLKVTLFTVFVALTAWAIASIADKKSLAQGSKLIIFSGLLMCLFGFYQFFGDLVGLSPNITGLRPQYTKDIFGFPRIQAAGLEPLYFANFLLVPIGLLMAGLSKPSRRRSAGLLILMTVVWLTVSRGAAAGLIIMAFGSCVYWLWRRDWRAPLRLVSLAIVSIGLALGFIALGSTVARGTHKSASSNIQSFSQQSTNTSTGESAEGRSFSRGLALRALREHPLLGVGAGNFGIFALEVAPERYSDTQSIVNNEPLEILAETGLVGALFFIIFVVSLLASVARNGSRNNMLVGGLILALIGIAVQYQTFSTLYIMHIWATIGLLLGAVRVSQTTPKAAK